MPRTFASEYDGEDARRARVRSLMRLSPASRHRSFMEDYDRFHRGPDAARERARVLHRPLTTDAHVVRDTFRFLRDDEEDAALGAWESRVARRYYDKLFREYIVADLSRWRERRLGARWRVEREVVLGKGQFICGEKHCDETRGLASYEVHFAYEEAGEQKEALVKLRCCAECAEKLRAARGGKEEDGEERRRGKKRKKCKKEREGDSEDGQGSGGGKDLGRRSRRGTDSAGDGFGGGVFQGLFD
jgi:protein FRA10AC1